MNKFIKKVAIIFVFLFIFTLTGCKKDTISIANFKEIMESKGFQITDSKTAGVTNGAKGTVLASSAFETYQVELYEFSSSDEAKKRFEDHTNIIEDQYSPNIRTSTEGTNYSKAKYKTSDKCIIMYRVDNIYIFAVGNNDDENKMIELVEELGY